MIVKKLNHLSAAFLFCVIALSFSIPSIPLNEIMNKYKTIFGSHVEKKPASK